ncbi:MAG: hypothetical protein EOO08_14435 [Chitinophagaceae bacterium]|nr:MAG: hypothetical protein EOO08_14435 [Chitinophagaceae bacterium]
MRFLVVLFLTFLHPAQDPTTYICTGQYAKRYHFNGNCNGLQACRAQIITTSLSRARGGRTPCRLCTGNAIIPVRSASPAVSDGRCSATTRKGTRCSRSARSGGYCWQHGG